MAVYGCSGEEHEKGMTESFEQEVELPQGVSLLMSWISGQQEGEKEGSWHRVRSPLNVTRG